MYYELIDLLRSPEVIKVITGSCVDEIQERIKFHEERKRKEALEKEKKESEDRIPEKRSSSDKSERKSDSGKEKFE